MPRVTLGTDKRDEAILGLIGKYRAIRRLSNTELIKKTGINRSKYYSRIADPNTFTLLEIRTILDALNVPNEERKGVI